MKNKLFAALIGFSLVSEFVLLSVSEVCGMEVADQAQENYIQQRRDLYQREDGVGFFIEDGKRFLTENPDWKELYDYAYIYYINYGYHSYWKNKNDYILCNEFIAKLILFLNRMNNPKREGIVSFLLLEVKEWD